MSESTYANTTEEQIRNLEAMAEQLQGLLSPLYEKRIQETRIVSDDDRQVMMDHLVGGIDPDKNDSYEKYVDTRYICRGWNDYTDAELMRVWFDYQGPHVAHIQDLQLWRDSLSNNLGAIAALAEWMESH